MAKHIFKGSGAPAFAPKQVGHHYIDTLNELSYISTGTASSADWKLFNDSVVSVNGETGTVILDAGDIPSTPTGDVAATNVQAAIAELASEKQATSEKGQPNGYAGLDGSGKVPAAQLPSYVDDVVEYANLAAFPVTGDTGKIYVALDTNKTYRWTGSTYVEISPSEVNSVFGRTGVVTAQSGDYNASQVTNTPAGTISATNVQAALNELDTEKVPTTRTVSAGAGLSGGGDLSANRTISMPNVGTAGTYGSASQVPVVTTDAQGRVSGAANTPIAITSAAVTDFVEAAQDAIGAAIADTASVDLAYNDAGNQLTATVLPAGVDHNALANLATGDVHTQYVFSAGRSGGQTVNGGTAASQTLTLSSTANATKGKILFGTTSAYDEVNSYLGINVTSPRGNLHVENTSTAQIRGIINFHYSSDTVSAKASFGKARGTPGSPTAVLTSDVLANYAFFGYGTTDFIQAAAIRAVAQQTFTDSAAGTQLELQIAAVGGTAMQTALTLKSDTNAVFAAGARIADSSDTTNGNLRYAATNTEFLGRENGTWKNLTITPSIVSATADTSTTSGTYAVISGMTLTPATGTYLCIFNCEFDIASDTNGDVAFHLAGAEQTNTTRNLAIDGAGIGVSASQSDSLCIVTTLTVNGSQAIDVRFRENGGGTLTVGSRQMLLIPISR